MRGLSFLYIPLPLEAFLLLSSLLSVNQYNHTSHTSCSPSFTTVPTFTILLDFLHQPPLQTHVTSCHVIPSAPSFHHYTNTQTLTYVISCYIMSSPHSFLLSTNTPTHIHTHIHASLILSFHITPSGMSSHGRGSGTNSGSLPNSFTKLFAGLHIPGMQTDDLDSRVSCTILCRFALCCSVFCSFYFDPIELLKSFIG